MHTAVLSTAVQVVQTVLAPFAAIRCLEAEWARIEAVDALARVFGELHVDAQAIAAILVHGRRAPAEWKHTKGAAAPLGRCVECVVESRQCRAHPTVEFLHEPLKQRMPLFDLWVRVVADSKQDLNGIRIAQVVDKLHLHHRRQPRVLPAQ